MSYAQVIKEDGAYPIKIWTHDIEDSALSQLKNIARLPFIHHHGVVAMPDVHYGLGATIGSVIATDRAIIPAAVGVDIGCGMLAVKLSLTASDLPDDLGYIRSAIEREVLQEHTKDMRYDNTVRSYQQMMFDLEELLTRHGILKANRQIGYGLNKAIHQLGTLGGGNHFVELCLDESQNVWVMLHSGSRGIGNMIGNYFIELAKRDMEQYFITLPDQDLAYFPDNTSHHTDYVTAVEWAQEYALQNRLAMYIDILEVIKKNVPAHFHVVDEAINCHHNYVEREHHFGKNVWVTRKGAIRARKDDLGIIPGSMGQRSYIVRGKGNCDSYHSCSHGAGRAMGRNQAKKKFTVDDLIVQTKGVECRKDEHVLDEIPGAYKDIDVVMDNQRDLVDVVHILKQVLCVKG
jgi:tRNA-splicing ligase RtcB